MKLARVTMTIIAIAIIAFFGYTNFKYFSKIDLLSPIIDMNSSEITVSINDPITQVMDGVTATDSKDGDVTIYRDTSRSTLTMITCTKDDDTKQTIYISYLQKVE